MTPEERDKILQAMTHAVKIDTHHDNAWILNTLREILNAMTDECKHLSRTVGDDGWYCNDCGYLENDLDNLPEVANKHIGSDFNEFYIEAVENYAKHLENKLKEIECGECGKNMLECRCEDYPK